MALEAKTCKFNIFIVKLQFFFLSNNKRYDICLYLIFHPSFKEFSRKITSYNIKNISTYIVKRFVQP